MRSFIYILAAVLVAFGTDNETVRQVPMQSIVVIGLFLLMAEMGFCVHDLREKKDAE